MGTTSVFCSANPMVASSILCGGHLREVNRSVGLGVVRDVELHHDLVTSMGICLGFTTKIN